jgi:single-stranded DNA-binding protein
MTEPSVSFAGNLTDDPQVRYTEAGIARARFRVAVSGRREQEPSFFTVIVWRDQAEHAAESLAKGSRVVVVGKLQQPSWTTGDGAAHIDCRGRGRGAWAEPAMGDGDDHQGDTQLRAVADSTDAMVRDLGEACSRSAPSSRATIVSCAR